jgi:hypothetical protein
MEAKFHGVTPWFNKVSMVPAGGWAVFSARYRFVSFYVGARKQYQELLQFQ